MTNLNKDNWIADANAIIKDVLTKALLNAQNGSWDENYITTQLLISLGELGKTLHWESQNQKIIWDSYKQRGNAETNSGDILFFIKVTLSEDVTIEGVTYYEAKKMYLNGHLDPVGFTSMKFPQLLRIYPYSSACNVLFYDVKSVSSADEAPATHSVGAFAFPLVFAYSLLKNERNQLDTKQLSGLGKSWATLLADNFTGFGLDYRESSVVAAKEFINHFYPISPTNIVIASISNVQDIEPELDRTFIPLDAYARSNDKPDEMQLNTHDVE
ncbi:hypothetical protein OND84_004248 [Morganella morganii]|uniref:hypothetical protein n=1 Tax=Providencia huaxiensis TaxID=2027290 RepID=UPI002ADEA40A|nr:hypothetical protein [Morganella morganii]EMB6212838.1 hypothetical protein [Morganella morganii]